MFKKYLLLLISSLFHLAVIGVMIYLSLPMAKWYLAKNPVLGVDFFLSGTFVSYLQRYFSFPLDGWKYLWYGGNPIGSDYSTLYFYLMLPLANLYGLIRGIQYFALIASFISAAFCYLLFYELSKNRVVGLVLTLAVVYSANMYRSLIWAGGIPFFTTQLFLPLCLFLMVRYLKTKKTKWLAFSALVGGIGSLGHPQDIINYVLPSVFFIILLRSESELPFFSKRKLKELTIFLLIFIGAGFPEIKKYLHMIIPIISLRLSSLGAIFNKQIGEGTGVVKQIAPTATEIENWTRTQFDLVFKDTNHLLWQLLPILLVLFLLGVAISKSRWKNLLSILPWVTLLIYCVGQVFLFSRGINTIITAWYKIYWPVPVSLAALLAFFWGCFQESTKELFLTKIKSPVFKLVPIILLNLFLILAAYLYFSHSQTSENLLSRFEKIDISSSAFPEAISTKINPSDLDNLKKELKPKLMDGNPYDYRLYVIDATINIWWGALEEVPLTRGYLDPPLTFFERGGLFWLDSALGPTDTGPLSSLIEDWKTPEEVADNNVRFLLDWSATKYLEGNHLGISNSNFASNITTDKFVEKEETIETQGGFVDRFYEAEHWSEESKQFLKFYQVKSDLVSPILMGTNAAPILHLGGEDGYETLTRFLGEMNLGPRKIILVKGPKFIDQLSFEDLTNFEAIILYKYDYRNYDKAWRLIDRYVNKGGKVFVDTGAEVKESDTTKLPGRFPSKLPGIFPIERTIREDLGQEWDIQLGEGPAMEGVNFNQFSPLVFNDGPWNISHPLADGDLREGSRVILRHKGFPIVVETQIGKGKVIWEGFNLPYHAIRDYNLYEGKFFVNLLSELVDLDGGQVQAETNWISPQKRIIKVSSAKGVVFKEEAYNGWHASLNGKNLKIYKVGPTSPGSMYVRIPSESGGEVKFDYQGALDTKIYFAISFLTILFILDYLLGGKVLLPILKRFSVPLHHRTKKWWGKEDEY